MKLPVALFIVKLYAHINIFKLQVHYVIYSTVIYITQGWMG